MSISNPSFQLLFIIFFHIKSGIFLTTHITYSYLSGIKFE